MYNIVLFILPVAMAVTAWISAYALLRAMTAYLPGYLKTSSGQISNIVAVEIVAAAAAMSAPGGGAGADAMRPVIEAHLDAYLRVRLKEKLPVISTFIGESTIVKLKESMIEEIDVLLPQVMAGYISSAVTVPNVEGKVRTAIENVEATKLQELVEPLLVNAGSRFPMLCGLVALVAGSVISLLLYAVL